MLAVGRKDIHFTAYVVDKLLDHLERLSYTCRTDLEFIILDIAVKSGFDIFAEFTAVFNPDTILMVDLSYDSVLLVDFNVYQKRLFAVQPFTDQPLYFFFVYHTVKAVTKRRRLTSPLHPFQCKNTLFHTNIQEKTYFYIL